MRSWLPVVAVVFTTFGHPCFAQHTGWHTEYGEARSAADRDGLPILLHFHAWYCGPCQRMDRDVFPDPDVQKALGTRISAVQIDVTHEPELASRHGATTVPRDVVVFADGTEETLNVGYLSKSAYLAMLRDVSNRGQQRKKEEVLVPVPFDPAGKPNSPVHQNAENNTRVTPEIRTPELVQEIPEGTQIVGLEGYCPVRLITKRQWTPGQPDIFADFRDIRYQFATEADKQAFLINPSEYTPQDLGCDPIVLTADRRAMTGSIKFGVFFDEKLYLFRSEENRLQFKQNPLKFIQIRSALKAEQIEGTRFQ